MEMIYVQIECICRLKDIHLAAAAKKLALSFANRVLVVEEKTTFQLPKQREVPKDCRGPNHLAN